MSRLIHEEMEHEYKHYNDTSETETCKFYYLDPKFRLWIRSHSFENRNLTHNTYYSVFYEKRDNSYSSFLKNRFRLNDPFYYVKDEHTCGSDEITFKLESYMIQFKFLYMVLLLSISFINWLQIFYPTGTDIITYFSFWSTAFIFSLIVGLYLTPSILCQINMIFVNLKYKTLIYKIEKGYGIVFILSSIALLAFNCVTFSIIKDERDEFIHRLEVMYEVKYNKRFNFDEYNDIDTDLKRELYIQLIHPDIIKELHTNEETGELFRALITKEEK